MSYMINHVNAVTEQLEKFTTGYAHHVVGQHANMDFWASEARHALDVLADYGTRFNKMASAQKSWVDAHDTTIGASFCSHCGGPCELQTKMTRPDSPKRYASSLRDDAARRLKDAAYRFFLRCCRMGLLDEAELRSRCKELDTSVDLADLDLADPNRDEASPGEI